MKRKLTPLEYRTKYVTSAFMGGFIIGCLACLDMSNTRIGMMVFLGLLILMGVTMRFSLKRK